MNQRLSGYGKVIAVLDQVLAGYGPRGVRELAEVTGIARSTVGRLLQSLAEAGIVQTTGNGDYVHGARLEILMHALRARHPLLTDGHQRAQELAHRVSSTVLLAVYDPAGARAFILETKRYPGPAEYALDPGSVVPLHAGAAGQAIVMAAGTHALAGAELETFTEETITARASLDQRLDQNRRRGYVVSVGQHIELAAGVAAPFQAYGVTGSVSISRPKYSTSEEDLERLGKSVVQMVQQIEGASGQRCFPDGEPIVGFPAGSTSVARFVRMVSLVIAAMPGQLPQDAKLAGRVRANPATTKSMVEELVSRGLLTRRGATLIAGPLLLLWSARVAPARPMAEYAEPLLRRLVAETGETVGLSCYDSAQGRAVMTRVIKGVQPLSYGLARGEVPLHAGAAGKAILAHCPRTVLEKINLERFTERTLSTRGELEAELDHISAQGFATGDGERIPDAFGISAPVFADGRVAGSITTTIARARRGSLDLESLKSQVRNTARELSALLSLEAEGQGVM